MAIARALLADAPLLLLDDALSAVDTGTAARILASLRRHGQGRTVILVSHRLATVMDADQIMVLRHGRITEHGTHGELIEAAVGPASGRAPAGPGVPAPGWYAAQWKVQQIEVSLLDGDGDGDGNGNGNGAGADAGDPDKAAVR